MRHLFAENCMKMKKKNWTPCSPYPPMSTWQDKTSIGLVSMKKLNDSLKHGPLVKKHRPRQPLNTTSVLQTSTRGEHDYIAFDEYYNEPIGRSFGNCDIYNTTITWLRKHDHMARYFPIFLVFGAKFQYFDNGE